MISKASVKEIESDKLSHVLSRSNINLIDKSDVMIIKGQDHVESIIIMDLDTNDEQEIKVSAVFPYIGQKTLTECLAHLKVETRNGYLVVNKDMETNVPGLLAAGDTTDKKLRQLVTAAGDGCIAATSAIRYIKAKK